MKFSMAIPPHLVKPLTPLTDYDFALAQIQDPAYVEFYKKQREAGRFVIMDNGFHETGTALSVPELVDAAKLFMPTIAIAPDRLGDAEYTYKAFIQFLKVKPMRVGVGVVMQGEDTADRLAFFENVRPKADCICFPFRAERLMWFKELVRAIPRQMPWPPCIHLLGVSSLDELSEWRLICDARGLHSRITVDTTKPIKFGMSNTLIDEHTSLRGHGGWPQEKTLVPATPENLACIYYNIAFMRRYV